MSIWYGISHDEAILERVGDHMLWHPLGKTITKGEKFVELTEIPDNVCILPSTHTHNDMVLIQKGYLSIPSLCKLYKITSRHPDAEAWFTFINADTLPPKDGLLDDVDTGIAHMDHLIRSSSLRNVLQSGNYNLVTFKTKPDLPNSRSVEHAASWFLAHHIFHKPATKNPTVLTNLLGDKIPVEKLNGEMLNAVTNTYALEKPLDVPWPMPRESLPRLLSVLDKRVEDLDLYSRSKTAWLTQIKKRELVQLIDEAKLLVHTLEAFPEKQIIHTSVGDMIQVRNALKSTNKLLNSFMW